MTSETHDAVLVFSKTWGALYLFVVFLIAVAWIYWPKRKSVYDEAAQSPLGKEEVKR
jgi:cytochrome c oxidase cbb3-type subunit 4